MADKISELLEKISILEGDLRSALSQRAGELRAEIGRSRIEFEAEICRRHQLAKQNIVRYCAKANPLSVFTAPIIYSLIIPLLLLDLFLFIYQHICFRAYGIERVRRGDYLIFDRSHLAYLNGIEKLNCAYCSYANGVIAYAREIAGRTEAYWCPIKHARAYLGSHPYYRDFADFGDSEAYQNLTQKPASREKLSDF